MKTTVTPTIATGTYAIDPARSVLRLRATHSFGLKPVTATFQVLDGMVTVADDPAMCSAQARIDAASFRSDTPKRDADISSKHFLDASTYPEMGFVSTGVTHDGDAWQMHGDLTVHGITQPVTLELVSAESAVDGCRMKARTRIDRLAFKVGIRPIVGRYVDLDLDVVAA